jgi:hypothetical protein
MGDMRVETKIDDRWCLAFVSGSGQFAITPPVWKEMKINGQLLITRDKMTNKESVELARTSLDKINADVNVNLAFALKAGRDIGSLYGHEAIEPLALEDLMIRLQTINLPKVPKAVKNTFEIDMDLLQALAWSVGMIARARTLPELIETRGLLRYLTTKGIFKNKMFQAETVFRQGATAESIVELDAEEYGKRHEATSISAFFDLLSATNNRLKDDGAEGMRTLADVIVGGSVVDEDEFSDSDDD